MSKIRAIQLRVSKTCTRQICPLHFGTSHVRPVKVSFISGCSLEVRISQVRALQVDARQNHPFQRGQLKVYISKIRPM